MQAKVKKAWYIVANGASMALSRLGLTIDL